ncbi:MAG: MBL fold metallo-hydrolase [Bryobacteraceae bacterium]|nr:MBL fold metallo-hydrolase [Bryobacteraceae bacterium]
MMANVYFIGPRQGPWTMVDAGTPGSAAWLRSAAQSCYGDRPPEAILLTHGHFDHVGAIDELAEDWDIPIYAHRLEHPYLDGQSDYPPCDPTVGGFMAQLSRLFPHHGYNFGGRLQPLGDEPIAGWKTVASPGHTAGHVSFFREQDRTLIVGDAFVTVNQNSFAELLSQHRQFFCPPPYLTQDWGMAIDSIVRLAELRPHTVAAGHGLPMSGEAVPHGLLRFAARVQPPREGRYVNQPVVATETGLAYIPPGRFDPAPALFAAGVAVGLAGTLYARRRARG